MSRGCTTFACSTSVVLCLTLLGAAPPASADPAELAYATLVKPDQPTYTADSSNTASVYFEGNPLYVEIFGTTPGSSWSAVWLLELYYTTRLGSGKTLVASDDAGHAPCITDDNGSWHRYPNGSSSSSWMSGTASVPLGSWTAVAKAYITASPTGGGNSVESSQTSSHDLGVMGTTGGTGGD